MNDYALSALYPYWKQTHEKTNSSRTIVNLPLLPRRRISSAWAKGFQPDRGLVAMQNTLSANIRIGHTISLRRLILLCHKFRCLLRAAQYGQRESVVARAATNLRRIVAIEFGTWRSGRNGGSSGLVTFA